MTVTYDHVQCLGCMKVAALYDIHGNLPALRAVLADAGREGVDVFVIGGDVASGPFPRETLDQLMSLGDRARYVRGNADREAVEAYDEGRTDIAEFEDPASRWAAFTAGQISRVHRDLLASFAPVEGLEVDGLGRTLFCHGSPRSDTEILTRLTPDDRLRSILVEVEAGVVVGGHVHQRYDRSIDGWRVINPGSVGLPYEGTPGAYWALLGPDVELRRTEYDLDQALEQLRAGGFPDVDLMLEGSLLEPAEPGEVAEIFERQAIDDG